MRLESITIRNMGPFTERHVDLTALPTEAQLVAVTGSNGAGKSTLLELATGGALYRECATRGSLASLATARDASLEVRIVNGQPWTIRHTVDAVSGKGESVALDAAGSPVTAGAKVREFDAWAKQTLLPPSVLYSSIVAPQGSGGFLALKPGDRKAALLRLLGVERLEGLAQSARERARDAKAQLSAMQSRIDDERAGGASVEACEEMLASSNEEMLDAVMRATAARDALASAMADAAVSRELRVAYDAAVKARTELLGRLDAARVELDGLQRRVRNNRALLADADAVRAAVADVDRLGAELGKVSCEETELSGKAIAAEDRRMAAVQASKDIRHRIVILDERIDRLRSALEAAPRIEAAVAALPELRDGVEKARAHVTSARRELERLQAQRVAGAEERVGSLRGSLDQIRRDAPHGLTGDEAGRIAADALDEDNRELERAEELPRELECCHGELAMFESALEQRQRELAVTEALAARADRLAADREELSVAEAEREALVASEEEARRSFDAAVAAGSALDDELLPLRTRIATLRAELAEARTLAEKATPLAQAEARLAELEPQADAMQATVDELHATLSATPDPVRPPPAQDVAPLEGEVRRLEASARAAQSTVARHEAALESARAAEAKLGELTAHASAVEVELGDWNRLAADLGRDGLQATLIDAAGPELTGLTNDLLRSCVGSRWTISFETTRLSADGKRQLEGLDVRVLDSERGRDTTAETLSGGERVLVGEAVSLALSVLACRRAGIERPTLVRDESGAALDPERGEAYVAMLRRAVELTGADRCLLVSHSHSVQELCDARIEL